MTDVSCETRIAAYLNLIRTWNARISLTRDLRDPWRQRLQLDQARKLSNHLRGGRTVDLGSGNGFPIVPALLYRSDPGDRTTLVEVDERKAAFLRAARRETGLSYDVRCARVEDLPTLAAEQITAQAFAPLPRLIELAWPHLAADGAILALKGSRAREEIDVARKEWDFECEAVEDDPAVGRCILRITQARKR